MPMTDNIISEHKARGRRRRQNFDSEREILRSGVAGPSRTQSGGYEGHATVRIQDGGEEGGKSPHQPEHVIRPGARAVHGLSVVASQGTGEMGSDVERAEPTRDT